MILYRILSFISIILLIISFIAYKGWSLENKEEVSNLLNPEIFLNLSENQLLQIQATKITECNKKYIIDTLKGWLFINNHKAIFLDSNQAIWHNNQLTIDDFVRITWNQFNFLGKNASYNINNRIVNLNDIDYLSDVYQAHGDKLQINLQNNNFILHKPLFKIVNINLYDK
jgi:hypothetical protein